jgi:hypothetical protein
MNMEINNDEMKRIFSNHPTFFFSAILITIYVYVFTIRVKKLLSRKIVIELFFFFSVVYGL